LLKAWPGFFFFGVAVSSLSDMALLLNADEVLGD